MSPVNTRSMLSAQDHADQVRLIAGLVDGAQYRACHVEHAGRCQCCHQPWPCDGRRLAEQVVAHQALSRS